MNNYKKIIAWVMLFAIAMGFMESAVVIYLRELYYKDGFQFPLRIIPAAIGKVEFIREFCTVIMLVGIGIVAGKGKLQRFAYFVLAFAVWDIFYYVFLYLCLGWPQSLSTWDILFLIPVPWVGPVWAPCLLCLLMIYGSVFVIRQTEQNPDFKVEKLHWGMLIGGAAICIISFMWDYLAHARHETWNLYSERELFSDITDYAPASFNYLLFFAGFFPMMTSVMLTVLNTKKLSHENK